MVVMRWNDVTKTKKVKYVSMLSIIHTFELEDSKKKERTTGAAIMKPDVILSYKVVC